jgi:hypothetical protein
MPPNGERINARIRERILGSDFSLTVYYAEVRPKPTGTAPLNISDVSLLLPTALPVATPDEAPEQVQPSVTMKCLFTDAHQLTDLRQKRLGAGNGLWTRDATALVRVLAEDAELASGGLVFDGCKWVEVNGRRYKVMEAVRVAVSSEKAGTYYVYLSGSVKS